MSSICQNSNLYLLQDEHLKKTNRNNRKFQEMKMFLCTIFCYVQFSIHFSLLMYVLMRCVNLFCDFLFLIQYVIYSQFRLWLLNKLCFSYFQLDVHFFKNFWFSVFFHYSETFSTSLGRIIEVLLYVKFEYWKPKVEWNYGCQYWGWSWKPSNLRSYR